MKRKRVFRPSILLAAVMLLVGSVGVVTAASTHGTGPDDALTPSNDWQPLAPGDSTWYAFEYAGDGSQIQVRLEVEPAGSAAFEVWTPGETERWQLGLEADPVGRGSGDPAAEGARVWSGSFNEAGTYYVVVERDGNSSGTSYYLLMIGGDGVSLAAPSPSMTSTPEPKENGSRPVAPSEPTGKLVFQTGMGGDIYTVNVDGSELQRVADGMDPVWSPGGEQIAFVRWREPRGVWLIDADGSNERRVFDWSEARYPSWSPDGEQIVFSRHTGETQGREFCFRGRCFSFPARSFWKLGLVNPGDGSFAEPLPNSDVSHTPDWSPGGDKIAFDAEQGLMIQSVDGTNAYPITDDARDTNPVWSPDGSQIAFTRRQHDHWEVYVVDADGGNLRRLTHTPARPDGQVASSASPAWSPAPLGGGTGGQYLAFLTDRTGRWEIWVMRADGSGQQPLFDSALDGVALDYAALGERAISWTE